MFLLFGFTQFYRHINSRYTRTLMFLLFGLTQFRLTKSWYDRTYPDILMFLLFEFIQFYRHTKSKYARTSSQTF